MEAVSGNYYPCTDDGSYGHAGMVTTMIEELVEKYHAQLDYYGRALEQITGKKVKEKVLYSFTLGEACSLS